MKKFSQSNFFECLNRLHFAHLNIFAFIWFSNNTSRSIENAQRKSHSAENQSKEFQLDGRLPPAYFAPPHFREEDFQKDGHAFYFRKNTRSSNFLIFPTLNVSYVSAKKTS